MGKYTNKKEKKFPKGIVIILCVVVLVFLVLFVMPQVLYRLSPEATEDEPAVSDEMIGQPQEGDFAQEIINVVTFPTTLDDGNIEIESLFQFDGVNPDGGKQDVTDVAAIVLNNVSDQHLTKATVTATLGNGTAVDFVITDLPAGTSVTAFSVDNNKMFATDVCVDVTVEAAYESAPGHEGVDVSAEGMAITLKNTTSEALSNIIVYYRDVFDDRYFGGKTYQYTIEHLPAGESTTVMAEESLLGMIEVVRVAINKMN